jgi:hypothetical protein
MNFFSAEFFNNPFSLSKGDKEKYIIDASNSLTRHHYKKCPEYRKVIKSLFDDKTNASDLSSIPFIPVQIFKNFDLLSIKKDQISRTMTSSGTTGQAVSRIFLDKKTAFNQSKILNKIVSDFIGFERLPFYVVDSETVIKDRKSFSARGAGILGFSRFGKGREFILDKDMEVSIKMLEQIFLANKNNKILFFGFTFMIWQHLLLPLQKLNKKFDFKNAIVIHGGGWKKLHDLEVSNQHFKNVFKEFLGISNVYNYYGMVEQTGSIFFECEFGHIHTSNFSEVIIRDPISFEELPHGDSGLIQLISLLPESYPGHSILSEDMGAIVGEDDCKCGRKGKYFEIHGRVKNAEIRGCSDTYQNT